MSIADEPRPWTPPLSPKGQRLFDSYKRFTLLDGPRLSGKSLSAQHRLVRHLWEVNFAKAGVITRTLRQGKIGAWDDLTGWVLPMWIDAGIGFKYTVQPKMEPDSKMSWLKIRNYWGGESVCQLHSLEHDEDVETKFKDSRFSLLYLVEGDKFTDRKVFTALRSQLRALGVPEHLHQFIIDCNPPESGEDHFLHDIFIKRLGNNSLDQGPDPDFDKHFQRIQMLLEDNTFLSPERIEEQRNAYRYDPDLYARWTEGKWVKYGASGHFHGIYMPNIHVRGSAHGPNPDDWEIIVPTANCIELFTGWDIGDVNHAAGIGAKREVGDHSAFDLIDELVMIDRPTSIEEFVLKFLEKMDFWEAKLLDEYGTKKIIWRHWSDVTAFGRYRAAADAYDEMIVRQVSKGRISLTPVMGGRDTVKDGVSLLKKLLFQQRLFISAQLRYTQQMFAMLRRGTRATQDVDTHQEEKHIFDAWRYALTNETPMDMERRMKPIITRSLISVAA